jgi:membrane-bound ClpP family serine protease
MSDTIKPKHIAPTFGGTVVGIAAPTHAEQRLREEFSLLQAELHAVKTALHNKIAEKENALIVEIDIAHAHAQEAHAKVHEAYARLEVLEARWYERLVRWVRKVIIWL